MCVRVSRQLTFEDFATSAPSLLFPPTRMHARGSSLSGPGNLLGQLQPLVSVWGWGKACLVGSVAARLGSNPVPATHMLGASPFPSLSLSFLM